MAAKFYATDIMQYTILYQQQLSLRVTVPWTTGAMHQLDWTSSWPNNVPFLHD